MWKQVILLSFMKLRKREVFNILKGYIRSYTMDLYSSKKSNTLDSARTPSK